MVIGAWIGFFSTALVIAVLAWSNGKEQKTIKGKLTYWGVAFAVILTLLLVLLWYYNFTASGRRALVDEKSDIGNGIERTITVYTADGEVIAQYTGKIDLEANDGGYVLFDFEGKRYTYYNCFVESVANIE